MSLKDLTSPVQSSPEVVDDALKVSWDQHHQRDDGGEDQRWRRSKAANVSHGEDIRLRENDTSENGCVLNDATVHSLEYGLPHHVTLPGSDEANTTTTEEGPVERAESRQRSSQRHDPAPATQHLVPLRKKIKEPLSRNVSTTVFKWHQSARII